MPQIKIDYIVSFSSEQPEYPANNLLSKEIVNKRWVGQEKGSSSNSVVFQLEKSTQITSIHVGNFHSAFIEVLVGRSEAADQKYEVLLVMSSFMSPADSRNSVNISSVRTFTHDKLAPTIRDEKWDRIRIVCTQPYNRHVQYGLSFIHFFNSDSASNASTSKAPQTSKQTTMLGRFKLKNDSDDEDSALSFKPGELFARLKQKNTSMDAQIRNASSPHNLSKDSSNLFMKTSRPSVTKKTVDDVKNTEELETLSRKRDQIMYTNEDGERNEKIDNIIEKDKIEKAKNNQEKPSKPEKKSTVSKINDLFGFGYSDKPVKKSNIKENSNTLVSKASTNSLTSVKTPQSNKESLASTSKNTSSVKTNVNNDRNKHTNSVSNTNVKNNDRNVLKRQNSSDSSSSSSNKRLCAPNNDTSTHSDVIQGPNCFEGIVFVISGYINPKRSNLRDMALSLGAKYRPDWGPSCTHLICACPNTPKHDQVRRESKFAIVVTGEWIEECNKEKARLPWKWFATDSNQRISRPKNVLKVTTDESFNQQHTVDSEEDTDDEIEKIIKLQNNKKVLTRKLQMSDDSDITDIEDDVQDKRNRSRVLQIDESDSDKTDIEENISAKSKNDISINGGLTIPQNDDKYALETDSDSEVRRKSPHPNTDSERLLDHFSGIKFHIDPNVNSGDYDVKTLKRYILAYDGEVVESWPDNQVDVVITMDDLVDDLRAGAGKKCQFLRPEWVWKCNEEKTLYSYQEYEIR
ncbi:DNA repair protein XRCC1-like isoform X2 [Arctopsyche grandis]|uniref:DNA repair protein XRCC1-like isoform X2 n=1 Tax=Arctopsyche grandis TaxID=121162 RepID=UPI00406D9DB5